MLGIQSVVSVYKYDGILGIFVHTSLLYVYEVVGLMQGIHIFISGSVSYIRYSTKGRVREGIQHRKKEDKVRN